MPPRCFAPGIGAERLVALPDEEAVHLTRVLRLRTGALVTAFDGEGREFLARIDTHVRHRVTVRVVARTQPARESAVRIRLAQAALKGSGMDSVVRDATMLGVAEIQPVLATRVNSSRGALRSGGAIDRWRRIAIGSVKQCGRAVVPRLEDPLTLAELLTSDRSERKIILVEPSALRETASARLRAGQVPPQSCTLLAGPEGGWSGEEIAAATGAGFVPITLGGRTLRADAAAPIALGILQFAWGDL